MTKLYQRYQQFSAELRSKHGRRSPEPSYEAFVRWWAGLDDEVRQICERDFWEGYQVLLDRAAERMEAKAEGQEE